MANSSIKVVDNSAKVKSMMEANIKKALTAMGQVIVELTTDYMRSYYGKDIHITGDLKRSIEFRVYPNEKKVEIGSNLDYSVWVHNGTRKMSARPFLKDAIMNNIKAIQEVAQEYLGSGFKVSVSSNW